MLMASLRATKRIFGQGAIYPLCLAFLYKYWPDLFKHEKVHFLKTPEYISTNGKQVVWHYNNDEYRAHEFKGKGWTHRHIKGLGSLTEDEYRKCIREPVMDRVVLDDNAHEIFDMLFDNDSSKRKVWLGDVGAVDDEPQ